MFSLITAHIPETSYFSENKPHFDDSPFIFLPLLNSLQSLPYSSLQNREGRFSLFQGSEIIIQNSVLRGNTICLCFSNNYHIYLPYFLLTSQLD